MFNKYIALVFILITGMCHAQIVQAPMDLVTWSYKGDSFRCELNQNVKKMGSIAFIAEPDQALRLNFTSIYVAANHNKGLLSKISAPWIYDEEKTLIDEDAEQMTGATLSFDRSIDHLLHGMSQGSWLEISMVNSANEISDQIQFPSIRMNQSLVEFHQCRTKLPAIGYEQAKNILLNYELGQRILSDSQLKQLDRLISYIKVDTGITKIFVDAHTDNVGSSLANLQLSKLRADEVASTLQEAGIPSSLLEVRSHGARYPIANNATSKGQALNRRVTIRLAKKLEQDD